MLMSPAFHVGLGLYLLKKLFVRFYCFLGIRWYVFLALILAIWSTIEDLHRKPSMEASL